MVYCNWDLLLKSEGNKCKQQSDSEEIYVNIYSVERQKGLTTSHLYLQLGPFAPKLMG